MSNFIPNSFQIPNAFVDEALDKVSGNACKIYLLIVRKTRGWNKEADRISFSQIQKATGIGSSATVDKCLKELLEFGLINVKTGNEKLANKYSLNDDFCTSKNEVGGTSKNEVATSKTEVQGTSKTEDTENNSFKTTKGENKGENQTTPPTQNFENLANLENEFNPNLDVLRDLLVSQGVISANHLPIAKNIGFELASFNLKFGHLLMNEREAYSKLCNWFKNLHKDGRIAEFFELPKMASELSKPMEFISPFDLAKQKLAQKNVKREQGVSA